MREKTKSPLEGKRILYKDFLNFKTTAAFRFLRSPSKWECLQHDTGENYTIIHSSIVCTKKKKSITPFFLQYSKSECDS